MAAPIFPIVSCNALAVALLVWPETLFAGQLKITAIEGWIPPAAKTVPAYDKPGRLLVMRRIYPMIAKEEVETMNIALRFVLSAITATDMVTTKANA